jgi:hypothetical protein
MGKIAVVHGAILKCTGAESPSILNATTNPTIRIGGLITATIQDYKSGTHIQSFVKCNITGQPCVPLISGPWSDGVPSVQCSSPVLSSSSTLTCDSGGIITIVNPGQGCVSVDNPLDNGLEQLIPLDIPDFNESFTPLDIPDFNESFTPLDIPDFNESFTVPQEDKKHVRHHTNDDNEGQERDEDRESPHEKYKEYEDEYADDPHKERTRQVKEDRTNTKNDRENEQARAAVRDIENWRGESLSDKQKREFHDHITGQGYTYNEMVEEGKRLFPPPDVSPSA